MYAELLWASCPKWLATQVYCWLQRSYEENLILNLFKSLILNDKPYNEHHEFKKWWYSLDDNFNILFENGNKVGYG
jgi:hypothetical protein